MSPASTPSIRQQCLVKKHFFNSWKISNLHSENCRLTSITDFNMMVPNSKQNKFRSEVISENCVICWVRFLGKYFCQSVYCQFSQCTTPPPFPPFKFRQVSQKITFKFRVLPRAKAGRLSSSSSSFRDLGKLEEIRLAKKKSRQKLAPRQDSWSSPSWLDVTLANSAGEKLAFASLCSFSVPERGKQTWGIDDGVTTLLHGVWKCVCFGVGVCVCWSDFCAVLCSFYSVL